jgi:biopolymer transport protein ExbD
MVKFIALLLFLTLSFAVALPAEASFCRNYNDHSICILSIKRSAKNYWEYRAAVSVDGVERPIEVYNCRDRLRVRQDGTVVPFEPNDPGELICSFFQR